ncbi:Hypothetical_protein [Hexamita inflata]|uniref:Hypothetical_protein n=1 Tax=Hexamita inflata TaxID=28002 RepID=A0AA86NME0_9EUKA|nr:Hypothetical protein HINF_LOCUS9261 [Hexamita inflata]CAI9926129.1 Hypothetical protein HINF_LOCUS13774 [Hexamita inflata]CAI9950240.1 Hypothetical protein HINF_LOCUS37885 [Hexamita inflata]CAI9969454.1 Hypothetical protein HINF_LOCUS57099 [Hexamita inflata]
MAKNMISIVLDHNRLFKVSIQYSKKQKQKLPHAIKGGQGQKQTQQKMFREDQLIHLTNLGRSEAFVFSSFLGPTEEFIKYCINLNKLYHSFKISLCNFYVLVTKANL